MNEILREKLNDYSVEPPAHLWDGVQDEMAAIQKKKRMAYYSRIAAAAVVLLAFLAGWYFNDKSNDVLPEAAQNEEILNEKEPTSPQNEPLIDDSIEESEEIKRDKKERIPDGNERENKNEIRKELLAVAKSGKQPVEKQGATIASAERFSLNEIKRMEPVVRTTISEKLKKTNRTPVYPALSETDRNLIAENVQVFSGETETRRGWKMGINISPSYSSQVSSHAGSYARNMTYESSEANANVGGGISVQYKTAKRWSVESGVYYAQNGQKSGNSQNLFAFAAEHDRDFQAAPQFSDRAHFNTSIQVSNNEMVMNSTAGIIEFNRIPQGAVMAANPEESANFSNTLLTNGEFSQVFDFVEIPLYLRYLLIDSKIDVEVMGGLHAGLIVGNNVFMENEYGVQDIGRTKDISSLNISGAAGIGLNYGLGKHLSLAVEPRINYFLNSINSNPDVIYRPYRLGVYTGLFYEF